MATAAQPEPANLELRDYLGVLRRRWRWILAFVVLLTSLGLANALRQGRVYQADAGVLLDTGFSRTILFTNQTNIPNIDQQVTTEIGLMNTTEVRNAIKKQVGYRPKVTIQSDEATTNSATDTTKTRIIHVIAFASTPKVAQKAADDFAKAYVGVRKKLINADLKANIKENNDALENLDVATAKGKAAIADLDRQIPFATGQDKLVLQARKNRLVTLVSNETVQNQQSPILIDINQLRAALVNNNGRGIFKLSLAETPGAPISPRPARDGLIALLIGLGVGIIAAFLRDYYDDTIRTKEDLERIAGGVPVLGIIPAIKPWRDKAEAVLETMERPGSPASEAYRALRTAIEFTGVGREFRLIHVTSATAGEGKSTTACNLSVALARSGKDVILVDCDLRRPRSHKFFGLDNGVGFTTLLLGTSTIEESLRPIKDVPGLFVIPSGPLPPNPSELLDNGVTVNQLELLAKSAVYVIVDSPPLLPVADSIILGGHADATLLVVKARSTNGRSIARALELLDQVEAPVAGVVLNGVGDEGTYGYDYGYTYEGGDPRFNPSLRERSRDMVAGRTAPPSEAGAKGGPESTEPT